MELNLTRARFDELLTHWAHSSVIYAPKLFEDTNTFDDKHQIRYSQISTIADIVFDKKPTFFYRETLLPITTLLFHYTRETPDQQAQINKKKQIIFLRSCDNHAIKRLDDIYLHNKFEDAYYQKFRENTKFIVMGCSEGFENCFCVTMGTNETFDGDGYIFLKDGMIDLVLKDTTFFDGFDLKNGEKTDVSKKFVLQNKQTQQAIQKTTKSTNTTTFWEEYTNHCIGCNQCNHVCPMRTKIDGFTDMAGGISFRKMKGQRARFGETCKMNDFKKRFGYITCVGCGRCDIICPKNISLKNCMSGVK